MVTYKLHHGGEPFIKYVLVSFGSSLLLIVFLLMCSKKSKKDKDGSENSNDEQDNSAVVVTVQEEFVGCELVPEVEGAPEDTMMMVTSGSFSTPATLPNTDEPCRKSLTPVTEQHHPVPSENVAIPEKTTPKESPYTSVKRAASETPVFEYSGNSDSGNSIYARVKDVPVKEETAYAVVELQDKDYDFVNGKLIRRKTETNVEKQNNPYQSGHYDKPVSPAKSKVAGEEIENSGASGIYESVTECKNEAGLENFSYEPPGINDSGVYDSCGPPPCGPVVVPHGDFSCRGNNDEHEDDPRPYKGTSMERLTEPIKSDKKCDKTKKSDKTEHEKPTRMSKFLKFTHGSKKVRKSEENLCVDIPMSHEQASDGHVDNADMSESGAPPPLPSYDKLISISTHRKGQQSMSDINPSPASSLGGPSPGGSPRNGTKTGAHVFVYNEQRKTSNDAAIVGNNNPMDVPRPHHKSRLSEGNIPTHDITRDISHDAPYVKAKSYSPKASSMPRTTTYNAHTHNDNNPVESEIDITDPSLLGEPDYAEIEMRRKSNNFVVTEKDFDFVPGYNIKNDSSFVPGYTVIDYGERHKQVDSARFESEATSTAVFDSGVHEPERHGCSDHIHEPIPCSNEFKYVNVPGTEGSCNTGENYIDTCDTEEKVTDLDGENLGPGEGGGGDDNPDYAEVDFSKRDEERRVKNLYASIDYSSKNSSKKSREGVNSPHPVMYEGTYNLIPETSISIQHGNNEAEEQPSVLQCDNIEVNPLYEELITTRSN